MFQGSFNSKIILLTVILGFLLLNQFQVNGYNDIIHFKNNDDYTGNKNVLHVKKGPLSKIHIFEAQGNFGDTMTLFESKTIKAEFSCIANETNDAVAGITTTLTNPYKTNLTAIFDISQRAQGISSQDFVVLQPGETITIGRIADEEVDLDDDETSDVDNDIDDGVIWLSDGSYFSIFGETTIIALQTRENNDTLGLGYDCTISGPFIGITNYKHSLQVTKNADSVKDLSTYERLNNDNEYFENKLAKHITKYEDAVKKNGGEAKPYINHYIGHTFGTYVFQAQGNFGDTMTLFKSKTIKAEFSCIANETNDAVAGITMTLTNPYKTNLTAIFDISQLSTGGNSNGFVVLQPGETITIGRIADEEVDLDDETSDIDNDNDDGVIWLSDGSYFSVFGEATIIAVQTRENNDALGLGYDCTIAGPYLAGLGKHDHLKNTFTGPTDKDVLKANKLFSKKNLSPQRWNKAYEKLKKSSFAHNYRK